MKVLPLLAWRFLFAVRGEFFLYAATLALGVALVTGMVATNAHLRQSLGQQATTLLAADVRLHSAEPLDDFVDAQLDNSHIKTSKIKEFRANVTTLDGARPLLVEVKAVDGAYPLKGAVRLQGPLSLHEALAGDGAVVEASLLHRLGLTLGQPFRLGEVTFTPRAILELEPDRATALFSLGPRLIIPSARADATGLLRHGSRIQHIVGLRLDRPEEADALTQRLKQRPGAEHIRFSTPMENQPALRRFMDRALTFLGMTSILALLTGALGMSGGMQAHMERERRNVAILKTLGAKERQILGIYGWQALLLAGGGSLAGALIGLALPPLLLAPFPDLLSGASYHPSVWVAVLGVLGGTGVGGAFLLAPLLGARTTPAAILLRATSWEETPQAAPGRWLLFLAVLLLTGLLAAHLGDRRIAMAATFGLAALLLVARLMLGGLFALLRRLAPHGFALRWMIRGLTSSGGLSAALPLTVALTLVMTLMLMERNLTLTMTGSLREKAPAFYFIDVLPRQTEALREMLTASGGEKIRLHPTVRGRLSTLRGQEITPEGMANHPESWRFHRQYVLTWSAELPPGNRISAGRWWQAAEERGVSLEEGMATALGIGLGDEVTFDIQGIAVSAPVTSIRQLRWSDMGLNFFAIFSPAVMAHAPATYLASVSISASGEEGLHQEIARRFPNITTLPARQVLEMAREILERLSQTLTLAGWGTAVVGLSAIMASAAAGRRRRTQAHGVLRLLGVGERRIMRLALGEQVLLGGMAASVALILAEGSTGVLLWYFLAETWSWQPGWSVAVWGVSVVAVGLAGLGGGGRKSLILN